MEQYTSPLRKYKREAKLIVDLPSKGEFYNKIDLDKAEELEVFSMTPSDEMAVKTPDALFSGNATVKVINRCIPTIKNPWNMPIIDVDFCLTAIRLASYGPELQLSTACKHCGEQNDYALSLQNVLDHFSQQEFINEVNFKGFVFEIRPLTYREFTKVNKETFTFQRQIIQHIPSIEDEAKQREELDKLYNKINRTRIDAIIDAVIRITTPDGEEETNPQEIRNFLENSESEFFNAVTETVVKNRTAWDMPNSKVTCESCGKENEVETELDYSNFFELR